jgi:hypothetical protein
MAAAEKVFGGQVPAGSLASGETTLEVLRAGVARQPPVYVTARVSSIHYRGDDWIVDVPLDQLEHWNRTSPPMGTGGLQVWAFTRHLETADNNCLELTVEGRTAQAVVLRQVRFQVLKRRPGSAPRGVRLDVSSLSLGASMNVRNFEVDLESADVAVPVPMPLAPYQKKLTADFPYVLRNTTPDFPYSVHRSDPEQFYFSLNYGDEDIEWVAELDWLSAGRSGSIRIGDAGAPFASTAFRSRPVYIWNGGRPDHVCADEGCYRTHHKSRK